MLTDKESKAALFAYTDNCNYEVSVIALDAALEAAEKVRAEAAKETEFGDIGIDGAERLYKNVLGTWVAQGRSSTPVYPVKTIARWEDGEYHAFGATKREEKLREALEGKEKELAILQYAFDNYDNLPEED